MPNILDHKHFLELSDRLNVQHDEPSITVTPGPTLPPKETYELNSPATDRPLSISTDAPFAMAADSAQRARYSEFPSLPLAIKDFRSPIDVGQEKSKGPPKVFVSRTVELD